jgi:hypothetical protein
VQEIAIREVAIRLHEEERTNTVMIADKLTPRSKRHVLLDGNVSISTDGGHRELLTDRVVWWLDTRQLAVPGSYRLRNNTELSQGRRTVFDLALQPQINATKDTNHESTNTVHTAM